MSGQIEIKQLYHHYKPPFDVVRVVEILLSTVETEYLRGIDTILIRNQGSMNSSERRSKLRSRGRKVKQVDSLGWYQWNRAERKGTITLNIDNILMYYPKWSYRWFGVIRKMAIGSTLYHEIGHHIHRTKKPEFKEKEDVADKWSDKLLFEHVKKKHRVIKFLIRYPLRPVYYLVGVYLKNKLKNVENPRKRSRSRQQSKRRK